MNNDLIEVTIKIRKEDKEALAKVSHVPNWIHLCLNRGFLWPERVIELAEASGAVKDGATLPEFLEYCQKLAPNHPAKT